MSHPVTMDLNQRLARVRLFLCDVDGVLTNGTVLIGSGVEYKSFHIQDGFGLRLLQRHEVKVGWISNRRSPATQQRAEELKVDYLRQGPGDKVEAVASILAEAGMAWTDTCYLGDDLVDLGVLARTGVAIAVNNAVPEVRQVAHYVTRQRGGEGAVREAADLVLKAQQKWSSILAEYTRANVP